MPKEVRTSDDVVNYLVKTYVVSRKRAQAAVRAQAQTVQDAINAHSHDYFPGDIIAAQYGWDMRDVDDTDEIEDTEGGNNAN